MKLYNTLTQSVVALEPVEPGVIRMYCCGPTVYNYVHIGNLRTFVFSDFLRRALRQQGFQVIEVMNITDVDDKTIRGAAAEGSELSAFTKRYEDYFFEDCRQLNIERPEYTPRATEHVNEMVELVQRLTAKGLTYEREGSIYFRIAGFAAYGQLARLDSAGLLAGARVDSDEYDKEEARDFVLWKAALPGEVGWSTALGFGRPGWHLECSAMSMKYLGETFDLHTGAVDLIFPHHENEIAQSEAATGIPFVRHWVHPEHLQISGDRMGKSLGNQYTLREVIENGHRPLALRLFFTTAHYRQKLSFSPEALQAAESSLQRLLDFRTRLDSAVPAPSGEDLTAVFVNARSRWDEAIANDLNIPEASGVLFEVVRTVNRALDKERMDADGIAAAREFLLHADAVLGVLDGVEAGAGDPAVDELVRRREVARAAKDFAEADRIRAELTELGIVIEDRREGVRWRRAH